MREVDYIFTASDAKSIYVHRWLPEGTARGVLVIVHGMAEHGERYTAFARELTGRGWAVYASDHRGHGRTALEGELGWFTEHDGFRRVVDDIKEITQEISKECGDLPILLFGHCMGSLLVLAFAGLYGRRISGCILSGIIDEPTGAQIATGKLFSAMGCLVNGQMKKAPLLDDFAVGRKNRDFEPARTAFEWLSRDRGEVDAYAADPLCGFICSYGFFRDLFSGFNLVYGSQGILASIPPTLPFFIAAGSADPMGGARGAVDKLAKRLRATGIERVETRLYAGARHELLKETNRAEVIAEIGKWMDATVDKKKTETRRVEVANGASD